MMHPSELPPGYHSVDDDLVLRYEDLAPKLPVKERVGLITFLAVLGWCLVAVLLMVLAS